MSCNFQHRRCLTEASKTFVALAIEFYESVAIMAAKGPMNWTMLAFFLWNTCLVQLNGQANKTEVSIVLLYPFTSCDQLITEFPFASAFLVAVETINNSSWEFGFSLSVEWNDTRCSELVGIETMSEQWKRDVNAFIGPGNQSYCATSARIAASWNIPLISYVSVIRIKLAHYKFNSSLPVTEIFSL